MKKSNEQFQSSKVRLMIINEDGQNRFIDGFTKYMESYATFVEPVEGEAAIKDALFFRRAEYILTIPKGFTDHFLDNENVTLKKQMIPDSVEAISIDRAINNYLNMAKVYLKHMPEVNMDEVQDYIKLNLEQEVDVTFLTKMKEADTSSNEFNKFYFNFLDKEHIYHLILNYWDLVEAIKEVPDSPLWNLIWTLDFYIEKAELSPQQLLIVRDKKLRVPNKEIKEHLDKELGIYHQENYISTIWNKITQLIADSALLNYDEWVNQGEELKWKKCNTCGKLLFRDSRNFIRKTKALDGLTNKCKKCEKKARARS